MYRVFFPNLFYLYNNPVRYVRAKKISKWGKRTGVQDFQVPMEPGSRKYILNWPFRNGMYYYYCISILPFVQGTQSGLTWYTFLIPIL